LAAAELHKNALPIRDDVDGMPPCSSRDYQERPAMLRTIPFRLSLFAAATVAAAGSAMADVIDGDWCATDGRHMSIRGPAITTPGGKQLAGLYSRHSFSYVVPAPEQSAGSTITMRLINPETINLWVGSVAVGPPEVWNRCTPVSDLDRPLGGASASRSG
jgi:hypothetical protein